MCDFVNTSVAHKYSLLLIDNKEFPLEECEERLVIDQDYCEFWLEKETEMCYYKTDEFMQQSGRIDSQIGKNLEFEVWEQCKFRGYWNRSLSDKAAEFVWEQCKFRGYWNREFHQSYRNRVWEQCKFRGYWNLHVVYINNFLFESSVNSEGIETFVL